MKDTSPHIPAPDMPTAKHRELLRGFINQLTEGIATLAMFRETVAALSEPRYIIVAKYTAPSGTELTMVAGRFTLGIPCVADPAASVNMRALDVVSDDFDGVLMLRHDLAERIAEITRADLGSKVSEVRLMPLLDAIDDRGAMLSGGLLDTIRLLDMLPPEEGAN